MSAADVPPAGRDELREALAEALRANGYRPATHAGILDALLPVVTAWADRRVAAVLRAAAQEQRNEAKTVPDTDQSTHADGHRCAATFLDRRADALSAPSAPPGVPGHVPTDARGVTGRSRQGIGNDDGGARL